MCPTILSVSAHFPPGLCKGLLELPASSPHTPQTIFLLCQRFLNHKSTANPFVALHIASWIKFRFFSLAPGTLRDLGPAFLPPTPLHTQKYGHWRHASSFLWAFAHAVPSLECPAHPSLSGQFPASLRIRLRLDLSPEVFLDLH